MTPLGLVLLGGQVAVPVPDHADLAEREGDEDSDDVELDQLGRVRAVDPDEHRRRAREEHDAVGEGEPVAAGVQLTRQVAVLREDRAEQREAVVRRVGREEEDQRGGGGEHDEQEAAVAEDGLGDLGDHRVLDVVTADGHALVDQVVRGVLGHLDVRRHGEADDAAEHGDGQAAHERERRRGVLGLRLAEGGDAVADRLDAGERGTAGGEGPKEKEDEGESCEALVLCLDLEVRGGRLHRVVEDEAPEGSPRDHDEDATTNT